MIPMSMHIGAPCKPVVQKGDTVTVGQMIGATAGLGAPIHASVSGTVVAVEPRPGTGGVPTLSVVIENDFQNTLSPDCKPRENADALTSQEIIDIIRDAGCTGMGGAGFPTHVKISSAVGKADTIIINGAECEPYITADHRLMLEHGEKIIGGRSVHQEGPSAGPRVHRHRRQQDGRGEPFEGAGGRRQGHYRSGSAHAISPRR